MKRHFAENYHLIFEYDIPQNSFTVNGVDSDVPCVFQIWKLSEEKRQIEPVYKPFGYKFVKKEENPDISFRRVGVNAGVISKEIDKKSHQSHYFIKFTNECLIDINLSKLDKLEFESSNTVGPKSISKPELIKKFNECLEHPN